MTRGQKCTTAGHRPTKTQDRRTVFLANARARVRHTVLPFETLYLFARSYANFGARPPMSRCQDGGSPAGSISVASNSGKGERFENFPSASRDGVTFPRVYACVVLIVSLVCDSLVPFTRFSTTGCTWGGGSVRRRCARMTFRPIIRPCAHLPVRRSPSLYCFRSDLNDNYTILGFFCFFFLCNILI